jgi:predicted TIM-barrel fold metal-dependent hydrolase
MALDLLGDTQVMYASDYPHWDALTPWTVKIVAERKDVSDEAKRRILGGNAARFYGLA